MSNASTAWDQVLAKRGVKPEGGNAPTASAGETEAAIRERVREQETIRALGIISACELAGAMNRAATFIASGQSASEVIAELSKRAVRPKG